MSQRGRPLASTAGERRRVRALAAEGRSQRQIAAEVFGGERYRGRVERILGLPPERDLPAGPPRNDSDFGALVASGGDMAVVAELVARYERFLLDGDEVPSLAAIERLLRIKRILDGWAAVERVNALTRQPSPPVEPTSAPDDQRV